MDEIIEYLKQSIEDEVLSKEERRSLKSLVDETPLSETQLSVLRSKIFELASARVTPANYKFIVQWIKDATQALIRTPGVTSDAYFSPGEACRNVIVSQIRSAVNQLQICVFTISDDTITDAIVTSHKRGASIKIITDNDKSLDEGSDIESLYKAGIPIKMDRTSNHMHHKFMVVDGKTVITGSYNWTRSAARFNHENILLTKDAGVVKSFLKEFEQLWRMMQDY